MIIRKVYQELTNSLKVKQIIAITGLRRVGKTTAVKYLLSQIDISNKIYLDLERIEYRKIFSGENYSDIVSALEFEGIDFQQKAVIALDEIQLVTNVTSVIKYIYDTYDVKFIITGSSSFYMRGAFSESLAGRKRLFELWPLSFSEFLQFKDEVIKLPKFNFEQTNSRFISKHQLHYDEYVNYGGFPEVVLSNSHDNKTALLKDIFDSYINLDIKFLADLKKVDELYSLIKLLSARVGSKVDFSKIAGITGINRHKVKDYLLFLENTFFIKLVKPYVTNPDREIALQNKVYFTDSGLLNILGNINIGNLFENSVCNQLKLLGKVQYYARRTGQEIDFILDGTTAIEVKTTPTAYDLKLLVNRANSIGLENYTLVGKNTPGSEFRSFTWGGAIY
ncbi:MAG: ATP-binding protein [Bacteroidetes bacterium]|nr:ATP-binding protein [Bacteroidota bacterium]MBL6943101.1 ATP-binding protein [Bacteroidales bacterium]